MNTKYPETKQTLEALINLGGRNGFVKFSSIYNEVKRIRLSNDLMADPINLKGRIRRSLINKKSTGLLRNTEQSKQLSIMANHPYLVLPKRTITINEKGLGNVQDIENNSFMLKKN